MLEALELDPGRERVRIVDFVREYLAGAAYSRLVLGLSGGVDSALAAALCAEAAGPDNVRAILLPYKTSDPDDERDARLLIDKLGISVERFEITGMVQPLLDRYPSMGDRRKGNIMARCRMIALFDQSVRFRALVAGTSNRTEILLGYFTLYGDGAASLEPIAHLYKCQVRALARHMGVPDVIVDKVPSAGLWPGQTDEGELGFTYDQADQVLYLLTERELSASEIAARGFERQTVDAIDRRMRATAFKRCMPPALPVANRLAS